MLRSSSLCWIVAAGSLVAITLSPEARACGGGMFTAPSEQESVSVAGHGVVIAISKTRTVLWDRLEYSGAPKDFAWIMPVKSGAKLEVATTAWIESFVGGTSARVTSPEVSCGDPGGVPSSSGCNLGCGAGAEAGGSGGDFGGPSETEGVTVVHKETIGPYDTATIKSDVPGAIGMWLTANGYAIPPNVQPILDDYSAAGMEFLAARLTPGMGVQDMKPVRVILGGGITTFPMRMLAAGAKAAVPINLIVIAEGRYEAQGFANVTIDQSKLTWDFNAQRSDYIAQRAAALGANAGATWLSAFAANGGVFRANDSGQPFVLSPSESYDTLAGAYFARGQQNGEAPASSSCSDSKVFPFGISTDEVVDLCPDMGACAVKQAGQIDSRDLGCDKLTDLSTALVGMHPRDVWVTRLEAELPLASLAKDLTLVPAASQKPTSQVLQAAKFTGDACANALLEAPPSPVRRAAPVAVFVLGLGLAIARQLSRKRLGD